MGILVGTARGPLAPVNKYTVERGTRVYDNLLRRRTLYVGWEIHAFIGAALFRLVKIGAFPAAAPFSRWELSKRDW